MNVWTIAHIVARILFGAFFVMSGVNHFTRTKQMAEYARGVGNVPAASLAVLGTGVLLLAGGASILLGYHPRIGAALLVLFLVPAAFMMHAYWKVADPMQKAGETAQFWKNISLAGAALFIFGDPHWPWPASIGNLF
jgi:putative oxidoreductase